MNRSSISHRVNTQSILMWTIAVVLTLSPLWLGGVKETSQLLFAFIVLTGFTFLISEQRRKQGKIRAGTWVKILLAMGILSLLQVVPLPAGLVELLSPAGAAIASGAREAMGANADVFALSLQPRQTLFTALRLFTLAFLFMIVVERVRAEEKEAAIFCESVVAVGLLVLVLSMLQTVFGTGPLLGTYQPEPGWTSRFLVSSFINENHQAAFFNLTGFCALGVARNQFTFRKRGFYWASGVGLLAAAIASGSRAGLAATLLGVILYALFTQENLKLHRRRKAGMGVIFALAAFIGIALVVLAHVTENEWLSSGSSGLDAKMDGMGVALHVIGDYPILGAGANAFGDISTLYNDANPNLYLSHVENGVLQMFTDFGMVAGFIFLMALARVFARICWDGIVHHEAIGPVMGLIVVAFQNLGDFNLSMPGVAIPFIVILATLDGMSVLDGKAPKSRGIPRRVGYALTMIGVLTIGLGAAYSTMPESDDVDLSQQMRLSGGEGLSEDAQGKAKVTFETYAKLHPADAHIFYMEALIEQRLGDTPKARKWLDMALQRSPHGLLPRMLNGRLQDEEGSSAAAAATYRLCFAEEWGRRGKVSEHLSGTIKNRGKREKLPLSQVEFLEQALPADSEEFLNVGFYLKQYGLGRLFLEALNVRLKKQPDDASLRAGFVGELLGYPESKERAKREITQLMARHPSLGQGYYLQALLFETDGEYRSAWAMYETALQKDARLIRADLGKNRMATLLGMSIDVRGEMGRIRGKVRKDNKLLAEMHRILSMVAEREKETNESILHMEMATRRNPAEVNYWHRLARLCEMSGQRRKAVDTLETLLARDPKNARALEEIARIKSDLGIR